MIREGPNWRRCPGRIKSETEKPSHNSFDRDEEKRRGKKRERKNNCETSIRSLASRFVRRRAGGGSSRLVQTLTCPIENSNTIGNRFWRSETGGTPASARNLPRWHSPGQGSCWLENRPGDCKSSRWLILSGSLRVCASIVGLPRENGS